ncbi:MAG: ferrous iron transport protein A [Gammaproteobacteria bacterium]|nr:MAG: ferrous iron transport protein A [Gammaproteobacteria bacterium]
MDQALNLNHPETGFHGLISHIGGGKALQKKLMSLGLRKGQEILVLHQRHGGVVVSSNGSRVALGSSIAANVFLRPTPAQDTDTLT